MTAIMSTRPGFGASVTPVRGVSSETESSFADFLDAPQQQRERTFNFGELGMFGRFGVSSPGAKGAPPVGHSANSQQAGQPMGSTKDMADNTPSRREPLPLAGAMASMVPPISAPLQSHDDADARPVRDAGLHIAASQVSSDFPRQQPSMGHARIRNSQPFSVPAQPSLRGSPSTATGDQNPASRGGTPVALAVSQNDAAQVSDVQARDAQVLQAYAAETPVPGSRAYLMSPAATAPVAVPPQASVAEGDYAVPSGSDAPPAGNDATTASKHPTSHDENENSMSVTVSGTDDALVIVARNAQGGDIGLHQLMKDTAAEFGMEVSDFRLNGVGSQRSLSTSMGGKNGGRAR